MSDEKLIRNLAAIAIIILLFILVGILVLFRSVDSNSSLTTANLRDLAVQFDDNRFRITSEGCQSDICIDRRPGSNNHISGRFEANYKADLSTAAECLGQVYRDTVPAEAAVDLPRTLLSIRDKDFELDVNGINTHLRLLAGQECYDLLLTTNVNNPAGIDNRSRQAALTVFDQLLDIAATARVQSYRGSNSEDLISSLRAELYQDDDSSNEDVPQSDNDPIPTSQAIGDVVYEDEQITIVLMRVLEDSRCPIDVECIWAGKVVAEFSVEYADQTESVFLLETDETIQLEGGYEIRIVSIKPDRSLDSEISDDEYQITVSVTESDKADIPACVRAGCSNQLCISATEAENGGGVTTCEYRAEYACYDLADCELQDDGECGFSENKEFESCLENPPALE